MVSWPSEDFDVSTETAREDAITIINTWGVGRAGVDDGLVVLFDMDKGSTNHGQVYLYAFLFGQVQHGECYHHRLLQVNNLGTKKQVALQVVGIYHYYQHIGLYILILL